MRNRHAFVIGSALVATTLLIPPVVARPMADDPPAGRFPQTIVMATIPDTTIDQQVVVSATATSLLPVTVSVDGACRVEQVPGGSVIVATAPGECAVSANQSGDEFWLPAPSAQQTFMFIGGQAGVTMAIDGPSWLLAAQGLPLQVPVRVVSDDPKGVQPVGTVTATIIPVPGGPVCPTCTPQVATIGADGRATVTFAGTVTSTMTPGGYGLRLDYSGDARYAAGSLNVVTVAIVPPGEVMATDLPIVVSIGDSYISGEAGRWAGNALYSPYARRTDVGADAYLDLGSLAESTPGCHRGKNSEIHIDQAGAKVVAVNLACSGAETATSRGEAGFKPGLDFAQDESLNQRGQALELYRLASANPGRVRMVVQSIGGNDFQFGPVVKTCLQEFLDPRGGTPCKDSPQVQALFDTPNVALQLAKITGAIANVDNAMVEAGYRSNEWDLLVQDYPSPIPGDADRLRYGQTYKRQSEGGCGLFDVDLNFANNTMLTTINTTVRRAVRASGLPNAHFLDLSNAYVGNRLCEKGADLVGPSRPVKQWTDDGAMLGSEWVAPVRLESFLEGPYQLQESMHPNYWGQLTNQACVKLAWNGGDVRGGSCVRTGGIYPNLDGDDRTYPVMALVALADAPSVDARPLTAGD